MERMSNKKTLRSPCHSPSPLLHLSAEPLAPTTFLYAFTAVTICVSMRLHAAGGQEPSSVSPPARPTEMFSKLGHCNLHHTETWFS